MKFYKIFLLILILLGTQFFYFTHADTAKIKNPDNGHEYQRFDTPMSWHDAKNFCESLGGYLATITSPEEDNFVYSNLVSNVPEGIEMCWIGGTDEGAEGSWRWANGETWSYTNWGHNEPNNCSGIEHYLTYFTPWDNLGRGGLWNDLGVLGSQGCGCGCPNEIYDVYTICEWDDENETVTVLYFGASGQSVTGSQSFLVNPENINSNWMVTVNQNWIICTPESGIGIGIVSVSVDPSDLSEGSYSGTITLTDPNTSNSLQTISVVLNVYSSNQTSSPFGIFSTPVEGSIVRSSIPITGWVLDDIEVENVKIYRGEGKDLIYIGDAVFVEGARPDVEQSYPEYPMNYKAGWGYMMLTNFLPNGGNGTFTLHAVAADAEGNIVTLGTKTITVDNANAVKPFGAIDTPTQGGTSSGSSFINWGWVLTPQPNSIPTDGSTINVYVDGVILGHPTYNNYRPDIATLFPGYANSDGAVGYFYLDTTQYENGVHTIQWTATDDAGNTDGIGSRFFTISNTGSARSFSKSNTKTSSLNVLSKFLEIPVEFLEPVKIKRGFNRNIEPIIVNPDENGLIKVKFKELERFEVQLSTEKSDVTGYMIANNKLYPLPLGSTLKNGTFYWIPGPGFIGEYRLIFDEKRQNGEHYIRHFIIKIVPKFTVVK